MNRLLSVIIVNYKSAKLVKACVDCIRQYAGALLYEIIVVDNDSGDDSEAVILGHDPGLKWIQMGYNAGFSRANNEGIRQSQGDTVLLLNADTLFFDDSLSRCFSKFLNSDYVACGIQQLNEERVPQISGSYFVKGGINHLLPLPYLGPFYKWLAGLIKMKAPNVESPSQVQEVDWISGAYLMVRKSAIAKAGLMDEDFFLYGEEIEWCSRLKKVGRLCLFGEEKFIHLQGESINQSTGIRSKGYQGLFSRKDLQVMLSNHLRIYKQYGLFWFFFLLLNYSLGVFLFFPFSFLENLFSFRNPFLYWRKGLSFLKNVLFIWRSTPRILSKKPHFYKVL